MIAGFVPPTEGDILLDGRSIVALPAYQRDLGLVFQSYALFPHMSVARNVAFGLEMRGIKGAAREAQVADMLRLARLEPFARSAPPRALRRAATARRAGPRIGDPAAPPPPR